MARMIPAIIPEDTQSQPSVATLPEERKDVHQAKSENILSPVWLEKYFSSLDLNKR